MWLVVSFSSLNPGFAPRAVKVDFFVERVALGQVFLQVPGVFPDSRHSESAICGLDNGLVRDRSCADTVPPQDEGKYRYRISLPLQKSRLLSNNLSRMTETKQENSYDIKSAVRCRIEFRIPEMEGRSVKHVSWINNFITNKLQLSIHWQTVVHVSAFISSHLQIASFYTTRHSA